MTVRSRSRNMAPPGPVAVADQAGNGTTFGRDGAEAPSGGLSRPDGQTGGNGAGPPGGPQPRPTSRRALKNWRVRARVLLLSTLPTLTPRPPGGVRIPASARRPPAHPPG